MHYGYTYFLQLMFVLLCFIVCFQVRMRGSRGRGKKEGRAASAAAAPPP